MAGNTQELPMYLNVHGGYRHIISASGIGRSKPEEFVSAALQYRHQQQSDQFDIGAYYYKSFINLGLWYRGLPLKTYAGQTGNESVAVLVGFEMPEKTFRVGYSYDITISSLGLNNSMGAHEVSLVWEIAKKRKRNRRVLISCPKF
jgi:hypothetical protein